MSSDDSDNSAKQGNKLDQILSELISFKKYTKIKFEENKETNKRILKNIEELKEENKKLKVENAGLKIEVEKQSVKITYLERQSLETTINIPNVPKIQGEDVKEIFYNIAAKVGVKLTTSSIVKIYRKKDKLNNKPGDIIVKSAVQATHELLLELVKKKKLTFEDIGFKGNSSILYVNQELTPLNKSILFEAKKLQKTQLWKYVWEKKGYIYVRKTDGGPAIRINAKEELKGLLSPV